MDIRFGKKDRVIEHDDNFPLCMRTSHMADFNGTSNEVKLKESLKECFILSAAEYWE